ncbi:site-specific integrase [Corynebacterium lizhenjunii]|uniref:tyrosine-type recombinase/integrase n=1 Tax=Corynebacterium lizhenjunii TaxID=2709394 RepID=UPI002E2C0EFF|nr:site-specific integrase [Corynebacterium lizhenjunii]
MRITHPYGPGAQDEDVCSLRDIRLVDLTKADVYRWWDGVQRCYPEAKTVNQQAYKRLRAACAEAVERGMLATNPVAIPKAGSKIETKEKYLPTDGEIGAILAQVPARYRVLTSLVLHHGVRIGEAIALEVADVEVIPRPVPFLPRVTVTIRQNAQRITDGGGTHMLLQSPKTKAGNRTVPIMAADVPYFLDHLARFTPAEPTVIRQQIKGTHSTRTLRLLTVTASGHMVMDTSYRSVLSRAKERAGVHPGINPHTGRNWLITRLAEQGAHLKEIGKLLGQDDMETIYEVYMKVRAGRTDELMDRVSQSLGGGS